MRQTDNRPAALHIMHHDLKPVVDVGAGGVTNSDLKRIEQALERDGLVRVRVPFGSRERRARVLEQLAPLAAAELVHRDSSSALLHRPAAGPEPLPAAAVAALKPA